MAEDNNDQQERTEEPTPERREELREQGNVVVSREVTGVFGLAMIVAFVSHYFITVFMGLKKLLVVHFESVASLRISQDNVHSYLMGSWREYLVFIVPLFAVTMSASISITLLQSRFNFSWKRIEPDFSRINPISGLSQLVSMQALMNLVKSIGKVFIVGLVAYLVLKGEWKVLPGLMRFPIPYAWGYWGSIIKTLFWSVAGLLVAISALDYLYSFLAMEKKMKMSKEEVKRERENQEIDQHVRSKMRGMQRKYSMGKMLEDTKKATAVITNPTHFAVAIFYDHLTMAAPIVVAKGKDLNALRIREMAQAHDVPVIENPPLARNLFKNAEVGKEIPEALYRAVSEVIKYVYRIKGRKISRG